MGIVMKKMVLVAAVLAMTAGSSFAADMAVKAVKAPPPAPFDPWDLAFGSAIMNDYIFRGVTQSQAVGRGLFRAALQHQQGCAALHRHLVREHLVPEPRRG
jgi:hypothetical protein